MAGQPMGSAPYSVRKTVWGECVTLELELELELFTRGSRMRHVKL